MEVKIYKTHEIPDSLWAEIALGFQEAFNIPMTATRMKNAFCVRNPLGYGFHAVAISEEGEVAGYNVFSPTFYKNGLKIVVGGSTFVRKKYRNNEFLFMQMVQALRKMVVSEGYEVEVGVPNQNSRRFAEKILGLKYVCDLPYYILPFSISKCLHRPALSFIDPITSFFCWLHLLVQTALSYLFNTKEQNAKYCMEDDAQSLKSRFKGPYSYYQNGKYEAHYRLVDEDGIKTIYLMDFREDGVRTFKALVKAIRQIRKATKPDAVLYVGLLRLRQFALVNIPKHFVPKPLPFTCCILDKKKKDKYKDLWDAKNWNFSLMNFDVR